MNTAEPSIEEIATVVLEYLAQLQERTAQELRAELELGGRELPVDSILVVEIIARVEERFGVKLPADAKTASSTRSVYAFARTVLDAIKEGRQL